MTKNKPANEPVRCQWAKPGLYTEYHDREWGVPLHDDQQLFEFLILEGAQAGLSWETILNKRENYRRAFDGFDADKMARYGARKKQQLLADAGIVRNRLKVEAAIGNARAYLAVQEEFGTLDAYLWRFVDGQPRQNAWKTLAEVPAQTTESDALSRDLRQRGFKFVGSTICYAFMQAVGMVNDHVVDCFRYREILAGSGKPSRAKRRAGKKADGETPVARLKNLGPRSTEWLREVGIHTRNDLERTGAVAAYLLVKQRQTASSLNLLWALAGALRDEDWRQLPPEAKRKLKEELGEE